MKNNIASGQFLDLDPIFRFLKVQAHSRIRDFYRANDCAARHLAIERCIDLAHLIWNVIHPLTSDVVTRQAVLQLARDLQSTAEADGSFLPGEWWMHPANFIEDGGRQLVLDRLENLENLIRLTHMVPQTRKIQEAA
jgi:hypothetical protein